jgi:hypothetical protein
MIQVGICHNHIFVMVIANNQYGQSCILREKILYACGADQESDSAFDRGSSTACRDTP